MRRSIPVISACFVALLLTGSLTEAAPAPGCKRNLRELTELETSLKREIKIPFDPNANPLKECDVTKPAVEVAERASKPSIAIFVFDVTSTGRVAGLQLIGKKTPWAAAAQEEVSQWVFEPLVDGDLGITRVGVTAAVIAEAEGHEHSCGQAQSPVKADLEVRVCATR
ncbi:MAG TPA: hypothetical protein VJT80_06915 [Steroidobacteraceae bacterium]|nr:hypothetical protein [Steroidobacteraceae bacterium]